MFYKFFDVFSCRFEILSGIEMIGMFRKMFANGTGHCETEVGVDVDFANCHFCGLTKHIFGDTDGIGHCAAVAVDHFNVFGDNGRSTVENDGEFGQAFADFFEDIESQLGFLTGFEFVCAVAGADGDGEGVNPCAGNKFFDFFGTGVGSVFGADVDIISSLWPRSQSDLLWHE